MAFRDQFDGFEDIDLDTTTNAERPAKSKSESKPEPTPEPKPDPGLGATSPKFSDDELEADEAHAKLRAEITDFIKYAIEQGATEANPLCAGAAATAGLGKTSISLKLIAELLQGRTVWLFEPTLEMAAKALADAKQLGINAVMIRGREANRGDPVRWPPQCWKTDVAAIVARAGYSVWRTLCKQYDKRSDHHLLLRTLGAFPEAVLDRQQLLAPLRVGADENQDALPILLEPGREVDPVGPEIDVAPGRQVAALPALLFVLPSLRQAPYGRRRQAARLGTEQRRQRLLELAGEMPLR